MPAIESHSPSANKRRTRIGLVINPIAGLGGTVGLKGTDGPGFYKKAIELGAAPRAGERTRRALQAMAEHTDLFEFLSAEGAMGGDILQELNFLRELVELEVGSATTSNDTRKAAMMIKELGASLILFAGGDGTARDILETIRDTLPVIGIPCGVKMHSGVFAAGPESAGRLALECAQRIQRNTAEIPSDIVEVMDVDETAYRMGRLNPRLYGYLRCPIGRVRLQGSKARGLPPHDEAVGSAAAEIAKNMLRETVYLIGPGTSAMAVCEAMSVEGSLLGVDAIRNGKVVGTDLSMLGIEKICRNRRVCIILGVVGGQGFLLGRGNQQIPPSVLGSAGRDGLVVVSSEIKLARLGNDRLLVDTGNPQLDAELEGYIRVHTGARRRMVMKICAAR